MNNLNTVLIEGTLTRDPESKSLSAGVNYCRLAIANNRYYCDAHGEWKQETSFFYIYVYGAVAEACIKRLRKGRGIRVTGRLKQNTWTDAAWQDLADLGDMLVITHPHRDHTSYPLMAKMRGQGKPLVLPCVMTNRADGTVYAHGGNVHVLASDHADGVEIGGVRFWNFMGAQDSVPCNTYLMEIDGVRVADNGDSSSKEREWNLTKCPPADIIISSTWSLVTNIVRACQATPGFRNDRAIFLPSHENEIMHSVPHRESYREMYEADRRLGAPDFIWPRVKPLALGESLTWSRSR